MRCFRRSAGKNICLNGMSFIVFSRVALASRAACQRRPVVVIVTVIVVVTLGRNIVKSHPFASMNDREASMLISALVFCLGGTSHRDIVANMVLFCRFLSPSPLPLRPNWQSFPCWPRGKNLFHFSCHLCVVFSDRQGPSSPVLEA